MNKDTFLKALKKQLKSLKDSELQKNIGYYEEMIADLMENGLTEEEAIQKIGSPDAIAREVLENTAPENIRQKDIPGIVLITLSVISVLASIVSFIRKRLLYGAASVAIIGGADGPTSIFLAGKIGDSPRMYAVAGMLIFITILYFIIKRYQNK